ncbi:S8 family serine peptidase [Colwelliaceae bacterium BS250]
MKYRKSTLALCVSTAIFATTALAETATDTKSVYSVPTSATSSYVIQLSGQAALQKSVTNRTDYRIDAQNVLQQQDRLFAEILALDPLAKLTGQTRLLSNLMTVQLSADALAHVKVLTGVSAIFPMAEHSRTVLADKSLNVNVQINAQGEDESAEVQLMSPYLNSENSGEGVTVAIISTGIDYTLPIFGGNGVYGDDGDDETPPVAGSYLDALENGAVGPTIPAVADDPSTPDIDESMDAIPGFDGFPTDVVVGGWDFQAENWGNDGNPIDQNIDYTHRDGALFPTGMGTQLASIVHQLAPAAKLYAYKVYDVSDDGGETYGRWPSQANIAEAMEHALDPNQDGDISDHVDVVLLDAGGAAAFYNQYEGSGSGAIMTQNMIQKASALGMTVVTHAGRGGHLSPTGQEIDTNLRNWISWEGSAPAAITVGSVTTANDGETIVPAAWSPIGPVRGSRDLKPEVMSFATDIPVSLISQADEMAATMSTRSDAAVASAKIAAAVAVLKSIYPELGPVELKALLANTADHNIKEVDIVTGEVLEQAELIHIGHGVENINAATTSPVAVWNTENNQPYVQFGFHEVADEKVIRKYITLRNFSDTAQTYSLEFMKTGDKEAYAALNVNYPTNVSIPAKQSVMVQIEMTIDGTMLPQWPIVSSDDYVNEKLLETELNGYFKLTAEGHPELNLGWMVQARPSSTLDKDVVAIEFPQSLGWNSELGQSDWINLAWAENFYPERFDISPDYFALTSTFSNDSNTTTTYETYPVIVSRLTPPKSKSQTYGHKIKTVGGGIYEDARCEMTGKKLSVAVNLWEPAHDAMANWTDKIGTPLFFYDMFSQAVLNETGQAERFTGISQYDVVGGESVLLGQTWVDIDENGQPSTFYIDLSMEYIWQGPTRVKKSKLPVRMTPNGTNVVSEICIEDLAHDDISDAVDDPTLPAMVPELDEFGMQINEMLQCGNYTLEEIIGWGGSSENDWFGYCSSSTGFSDAEGYVLDENGARIASMVENTERGMPGVNELLGYFDQNFGFHIETDRDAMSGKYEAVAQFNPIRHGFYSKPEEVCVDGWFGIVCEIISINRSVNSGFTKVSADNPLETAEFSHTITLEPNEEATIVAVTAGVFGGVNDDFMVISTDDNFAVQAASSYIDADGGSVTAGVRGNQEFSVAENVDYGTVVGVIKLDKMGFFGIGDTGYSELSMNIINALPGTPFTIDQETFELIVANPDAIDYENGTKFEVLIQTSENSQNLSQPAMVIVHITDMNDVAPEVIAPMATVTVAITNDSDAVIAIDLTNMFVDVEGDSVTYSVTGLPAGVTYADGIITGSTDVEGVYSITVTGSDGINETSSSFDLVVEDQTTSSSGSFGAWILAFVGLSMFRRRK